MSDPLLVIREGEACRYCRSRGSWLAFVDETARNGRYGLAAVLICRCRSADVRAALRRRLRPGQRRIHFAHERDRDRRAVLSLIVTLPLVVLYEEDRGRAVEVRTKCWQRLVPRLVKSKVGELTIERIDGEDERDRRDIRAALTGLDALGAIVYRHTEPAAEPLLWIADAAAWTCGARKLWRSQLAPVIVD